MYITSKKLRSLEKRNSDKNFCYYCEICGEHSIITEAHHLIPLREYAKCINEGRMNLIGSPLIYLCPNCHSYLHLLLMAEYGAGYRTLRKIEIMVDEMDKHLLEKFYNLRNRSVEMKKQLGLT